MRPEALLKDLGLEQYLEAFQENAIDEALLLELTATDLKEIGVVALGHRKKILAAIEAFRAQVTALEPNLMAATGPAQRRQITIMFVDLVDSTGLSQRLDAEELLEINRAYQGVSKVAIDRYGGYIAQYLGDGILAYFGYPQSHEDDAERAIRAGLDLIEALRSLDADLGRAKGISLQVRIGIETGSVIVGDIIGQGAGHDGAVTGETPNLAARLQGVAAPGELVLGPATRALLGGSARLASLGQHSLKGFAQAIEVWRVDGLGLRGQRFEGPAADRLSDFVGRADELAAMAGAFARCRAGENPVLQIVGEPGIGKSRLIHEFFGRTAGHAKVLKGYCASHGENTAFFPFIDLLRRSYQIEEDWGAEGAVRRLSDAFARSGLDSRIHVPYLLRLLGLPVPGHHEIDPELIGVRTQQALIGLIKEQGRLMPTVLFVNDLHWLDERSADVLRALTQEEDRLGVLILLSFRPSYESPWDATARVRTLSLGPLSAAASRELFASRYGIGLDDEAVMAEILERTAGNPLFVEELARHMRGRSGAHSVGGGGVEEGLAAIPQNLAGLLQERIDAVSPQAQYILKAAAVVGRRFRRDLIGGIPTAAGAWGALEELEASGLIFREEEAKSETFQFKHALVQDVVYGSLLGSDRKALHGLVGERLEELYQGREAEIAEALARHFEVAEAPAKALRYAYLAGEKAMEHFALRDAAKSFDKVIEFFRSIEDPDEDKLLAKAISNQIQIYCWNCRFDDMVGLAERELHRVEALGEVPEVSRVLSWLGEGYLNVSRFDESRKLLSRALELGRALGEEDCIGYALGEGLWLESITRGGEPVDYFEKKCAHLLEAAEALGDHYLKTLAFYVRWVDLTHRGRISDARDWAERSITVGRQTSYPPALCWGLAMLSYNEICNDNTVEAERYAREAAREAQCVFDDLMAEMSLGMALAGQGRHDESIKLLRRAQRLGDQVGSLFLAYSGETVCGRALAASDELESGLAWLGDSRAHFLKVGNRRAACMAAVEIGELRVEAHCRGRTGEATLWERGMRFARGKVTNMADEAARSLREAIALAEATGMEGMRVKAYLALAKLARAADKNTEVERHLHDARRLVAPIGWLTLEQSVNLALSEQGTS